MEFTQVQISLWSYLPNSEVVNQNLETKLKRFVILFVSYIHLDFTLIRWCVLVLLLSTFPCSVKKPTLKYNTKFVTLPSQALNKWILFCFIIKPFSFCHFFTAFRSNHRCRDHLQWTGVKGESTVFQWCDPLPSVMWPLSSFRMSCERKQPECACWTVWFWFASKMASFFVWNFFDFIF